MESVESELFRPILNEVRKSRFQVEIPIFNLKLRKYLVEFHQKVCNKLKVEPGDDIRVQ